MVPEFARLLEDGDIQVLDVREERERADGVVPGAILVPYRLVGTAELDGLDPTRPVFTICVSGARATLAASLLERRGYEARPVIGGGVEDLAELNAQLVAFS